MGDAVIEWFDSHCHLQDEFADTGETAQSSPTPTGWPAPSPGRPRPG